MKDIVLDFSIQENIRYILADDGNRYNFTDSEWGNEKLSQKGDNVDFEIDDYKNAFKMHILKEQTALLNKEKLQEKLRKII